MPPVGFEPTISAGERPQTYALDRAVTGTGMIQIIVLINPLNPELNPICYLLVLLPHHFLHVSRIRVKSLTLRILMSYIYIYIWSAYS